MQLRKWGVYLLIFSLIFSNFSYGGIAIAQGLLSEGEETEVTEPTEETLPTVEGEEITTEEPSEEMTEEKEEAPPVIEEDTPEEESEDIPPTIEEETPNEEEMTEETEKPSTNPIVDEVVYPLVDPRITVYDTIEITKGNFVQKIRLPFYWLQADVPLANPIKKIAFKFEGTDVWIEREQKITPSRWVAYFEFILEEKYEFPNETVVLEVKTQDEFDNWSPVSTVVGNISDQEPPTLIINSGEFSEDGQTLTINATAKDNRKLDKIYLNTPHNETISLDTKEHTFDAIIDLKENHDYYKGLVRISVYDYNIKAITVNVPINSFDKEKPTLTMLDPTFDKEAKMLSFGLKAEDDISLSEISVMGKTEKIGRKTFEKTYIVDLETMTEAEKINIFKQIHAYDYGMNSQSNYVAFPTTDNLVPMLYVDYTINEDESITVNGEVSDDYLVRNINLTNIPEYKIGEQNYTFTHTISKEIVQQGEKFKTQAVDYFYNKLTDEVDLSMLDRENPTITDVTQKNNGDGTVTVTIKAKDNRRLYKMRLPDGSFEKIHPVINTTTNNFKYTFTPDPTQGPDYKFYIIDQFNNETEVVVTVEQQQTVITKATMDKLWYYDTTFALDLGWTPAVAGGTLETLALKVGDNSWVEYDKTQIKINALGKLGLDIPSDWELFNSNLDDLPFEIKVKDSNGTWSAIYKSKVSIGYRDKPSATFEFVHNEDYSVDVHVVIEDETKAISLTKIDVLGETYPISGKKAELTYHVPKEKRSSSHSVVVTNSDGKSVTYNQRPAPYLSIGQIGSKEDGYFLNNTSIEVNENIVFAELQWWNSQKGNITNPIVSVGVWSDSEDNFITVPISVGANVEKKIVKIDISGLNLNRDKKLHYLNFFLIDSLGGKTLIKTPYLTFYDNIAPIIELERSEWITEQATDWVYSKSIVTVKVSDNYKVSTIGFPDGTKIENINQSTYETTFTLTEKGTFNFYVEDVYGHRINKRLDVPTMPGINTPPTEMNPPVEFPPVEEDISKRPGFKVGGIYTSSRDKRFEISLSEIETNDENPYLTAIAFQLEGYNWEIHEQTIDTINKYFYFPWTFDYLVLANSPNVSVKVRNSSGVWSDAKTYSSYHYAPYNVSIDVVKKTHNEDRSVTMEMKATGGNALKKVILPDGTLLELHEREETFTYVIPKEADGDSYHEFTVYDFFNNKTSKKWKKGKPPVIIDEGTRLSNIHVDDDTFLLNLQWDLVEMGTYPSSSPIYNTGMNFAGIWVKLGDYDWVWNYPTYNVRTQSGEFFFNMPWEFPYVFTEDEIEVQIKIEASEPYDKLGSIFSDVYTTKVKVIDFNHPQLGLYSHDNADGSIDINIHLSDNGSLSELTLPNGEVVPLSGRSARETYHVTKEELDQGKVTYEFQVKDSMGNVTDREVTLIPVINSIDVAPLSTEAETMDVTVNWNKGQFYIEEFGYWIDETNFVSIDSPFIQDYVEEYTFTVPVSDLLEKGINPTEVQFYLKGDTYRYSPKFNYSLEWLSEEEPPTVEPEPPVEEETPPTEPVPPVDEELPPTEPNPPVDEEHPPVVEPQPPVVEPNPPVEEKPPVVEPVPPVEDDEPICPIPPVVEPTPPTVEPSPPVEDNTPPTVEEEEPPTTEPTPPIEEETPPTVEPSPPVVEDKPIVKPTPPIEDKPLTENKPLPPVVENKPIVNQPIVQLPVTKPTTKPNNYHNGEPDDYYREFGEGTHIVTISQSGWYNLTAIGSQGANNGGKGGKSEGSVYLTKGQKVRIEVGTKGDSISVLTGGQATRIYIDNELYVIGAGGGAGIHGTAGGMGNGEGGLGTHIHAFAFFYTLQDSVDGLSGNNGDGGNQASTYYYDVNEWVWKTKHRSIEKEEITFEELQEETPYCTFRFIDGFSGKGGKNFTHDALTDWVKSPNVQEGNGKAILSFLRK